MIPARYTTLRSSDESRSVMNGEPPTMVGRRAPGWRGTRRNTYGDALERRADPIGARGAAGSAG